MDLSILIVTYQSAAHIRACLDSLMSQTLARHRFEVVIVDNASRDDTVAIIAADYPWCRLIRSTDNLGFTGGNNLAKSLARGDRLLLLNPDTIVDPHGLDEMLRTGSVRTVAKLVLAPDGRTINSGGIVMLRSGWAADDGFRQPDDGQFEETRELFAGCGAALLITNTPGPIFANDFFTYYEDVANGWAALADGQPTCRASRSLVMHCCGASGGQGSAHFQFSTQRNRLVTTQTFADPFLACWATLKFTLQTIVSYPSSPRWKAWLSMMARLPKTFLERYQTRSTLAGGRR